MLQALLGKLLKKLLVGLLAKMFVGVEEEHLRVHLEHGRLFLENLYMDTERMSQPNGLVIHRAAVGQLELLINWKHLLTEKLVLRVRNVVVEGELVNRLRSKQEIKLDKLRFVEREIRTMIEGRSEGSISRCIKKKLLAMVASNLQLQICNVDLLLREDKIYGLHFLLRTLSLDSVPTACDSRKIHKLVRIELEAYHETQSKARHDVLSTIIMGEGQLYDRDDINDVRINLNIPTLKLAIDASELPKILRKLDPLAKPNRREPLIRPYKNEEGWAQELMRYHIKLAVERVQRNKFLKMLGEKRYNVQLLASNPKFMSLVFRMPTDLLQKWLAEDPVLRDVAQTTNQEESLPLFERGRYSLCISSIDLRVAMSKDILTGHISECSLAVESQNFSRLVVTQAKLLSFKVNFNQIQVLNKIKEDDVVVALRCQQQLGQTDINILVQNFKLNLNHEVIMRLLKTYYKLFPKQITLRMRRLEAPTKASSKTAPPLVNISVVNALIGLEMRVERQRIFNYLLIRRVDLVHVNHVLKCRVAVDHKFFINEEELQVLDGVDVGVELVRGKQTILIVRDTRLKCNFGALDRFLLIVDKMLRLGKTFTNYFNTRTFQVYNCQKIGLVKYIALRGQMQAYYTVDGNRLLLFAADRHDEHPDRIYPLAGKGGIVSMDSSSRTAMLADLCSLVFPTNKEFKQLLHLYEDLKSALEEEKPLTVLLQNTVAEMGVQLQQPYTIGINVMFAKAAMRSDSIKVLSKVDVEIGGIFEPILKCQALSVCFDNTKLATSLVVEIGDLVLNYSERLLAEISSTQKKYMGKPKAVDNSTQTITAPANAPKTSIGVVIKQAEVFFMVDDHNKFAKVGLSQFVMALDSGMTMQGRVEIYDLTSYPYTRFVGEPRLIFQMGLSFVDMEVVLTDLKAVFIMEVTMRLQEYALRQVDSLLLLLKSMETPNPGQKEEGLMVRVFVRTASITLYPTVLQVVCNKEISVIYKKLVKERLVDLILTTSVEQNVCITAPLCLRYENEQVMEETPFKLDFDLSTRFMLLNLPRLRLRLNNLSFGMFMKVLFNNIIFTDGFVLNPNQPKQEVNPNAKLLVTVGIDALTLLLNTRHMVFEMSTENFQTVYQKRGADSSVTVAFYKLRVKELVKQDRYAIINGFQMLKIKEDTFKSNRNRKVIKMRMSQGAKSHLEMQFEEIEITGNKNKLIELASFFQLSKDTPGIKVNTPSAGMEIEVQFPRINVYLEAANREFYLLTLSCLVYMDTNFKKDCEPVIGEKPNTTASNSITSVLKVNLRSINLRHYRQKAENKRSIMNRPDLNIILETMKEMKEVNPKTVQTLNVKLDNCRFSLSLRDLLSLYSVITYQQELAAQMNKDRPLEEIIEEEDEDGDFEAVQSLDNTLSLMVFQIEAENLHVIIANNYSELLLPLIEFNLKIDRLSGTLNEAVNIFTMIATLSVGYFNLSATRIEPILEPMAVTVEVCRNTFGTPNNFVSVVINKMLINLSDEMLQTYRKVSRDLKKIDVSYTEYVRRQLASVVGNLLLDMEAPPLEELPQKNLVTLFSFKNETGFLLSIYERIELPQDELPANAERKQERLFAHLKKQEVAYYRVTEDQNDFGNTFEQSVKFNIYFKDDQQEYCVRNIKINNMLRNQTSLKHWCLAAGQTNPSPERYFVSMLDITHYKKEYILKSRLYLRNKSLSPMIVRLQAQGEVTDISLKKDEEVPLPFTLYLRQGLLFQTKAPQQASFCDPRLMKDYILSEKELDAFIRDNTEASGDPSDSVLMVPDREIRMSSLNVNLLVDAVSKVQVITIMPVMRVYNYTPLDIRLEAIELDVPANSSVSLNQCESVQTTMITMREFRTKKDVLLYNEKYKPEEYDTMIKLVSEVMAKQKEININIKRKKRKGILEVILSARIVIINETGLPLLIYLNDCKSAEKVVLANQTDNIKLTSLHNNEYSKEVNLKELPHAYEMEYLEKNQETALGELYELCVNTAVHESYHTSEIIVTKVIEITPRYVIDNRTCFELEVTQPESFTDPIRYRPSSKGVLYWPDHNLERRVVVRTFEKDERSVNLSKWKWSGAFSVQHIRIIYFYVRRKARTRTNRDLMLLNRSVNCEAERIFFKAEVKRFAAYTCILIDEVKRTDVEYLLMNNSKYMVLFEQLNNRPTTNKDYFAVKPHSRQPFGWIEPDLKKKIKVSLLDGQRIVQSPIELNFETAAQEETCLFPGTSIRLRIRLINTDKKIVEVSSMDKSTPEPMRLQRSVKGKTTNYLTVLVKELGVSLIAMPEEKKLELFFARLDYISLTVEQSQTVKYLVTVKDFNIDNNSREEAVYPVLLTSTVNLAVDPTKNFFEFDLEKERDSRTPIKMVHYLRISLVPIAIKLDESLARVLLLTYRKLFRTKNRGVIDPRPQNFYTIDYVFETAENKQLLLQATPNTDPMLEWQIKPLDFSTNFIHIRRLSLPKLDITLTFNHIYSLRTGGNQVFGDLYASFGLVIPNFENAPIKISGVEAEDIIDTTAESVFGEIFRVYKNQIIANVLRVVGSANILGNPVRVFLILKNSLVDLFDRPRRALIYGPAAVVLTVLQGLSGLLKASLTSTLHFLHSISSAVTNGLLYISFDDYFIDKRRQLNRFEPGDILEALEASFSSIAFGFRSAITGLNIHNRRYTHVGFGVATVRALTGFLVKPISSVMDSFNHVLKGTQNMMTSEYYRPMQQRHRRMRVFYEKIRYFKEESETDARVMQFLNTYKTFSGLKLIEVYPIRTTNVVYHLVLTIEYFILIESGKVAWQIRPRDINSIGFIRADRNDPLKLRDRAKIVLYYNNKQRGHNIILEGNDKSNDDLYERLRRLIDDLKNT